MPSPLRLAGTLRPAASLAIRLSLAAPAASGFGGRGASDAGSTAPAEDSLRLEARDHAIRTPTEFDTGKVTRLPDGRALREYWVEARDAVVEVAPGVRFFAWTQDGAVPGPTLRRTEDDSIRIYFTNRGTMPHSMHFHGVHRAEMDGVAEQIVPGDSFLYAFNAALFGLHLYQCHTLPVKLHITRGRYRGSLVDPK